MTEHFETSFKKVLDLLAPVAGALIIGGVLTEYASWRSLRESEDARYLGLAMPRFLARLPYGSKTSPV